MAKKLIKQLSGLRNFSKMFDPAKVSATVIERLANEGQMIIEDAYYLRDWNNRTYNLRDSFVSAVFVNGRLADNGYKVGNKTIKVDTIRYIGPELSKTEINYGEDEDGGFAIKGRTEAENFLKAYQAKNTGERGISLVVAAAMYYASILENYHGYAVISHMDYSLEELLRDIRTVKIRPFTGANHTLNVQLDGVVRREYDVYEGSRTFRFKYGDE